MEVSDKEDLKENLLPRDKRGSEDEADPDYKS